MLKFPGPSIATGKFHKALQVPNTAATEGNKLSLGLHENDCLGNVTLCPDGVTVSLWIYMFSQYHQWPYMASGSMFEIMGRTSRGQIPRTFQITLFNGTHKWTTEHGLIYSYWHYFAFVYTKKDGYTLFFDGYHYNPIIPTVWVKASRNLELGCREGSLCSKAKYDDLRVWNEAKDENFIWHLWQS